MGRTPDYMNVTFAGFAGRADEWAVNGNERGAANLVAYQKFLARNDISLTHTIIHPTIDKSKGDVPEPGNEVALHKVADTAHGIVVRGARILATLAPFADEIAVYPAVPLLEGTDAYALSFCVPMDTPGLKFICRDSCATPPNRFDHPLSSRFDEQDAFVIFDDVEVPRDRVFINANRVAYNTVMTTGWYPNIMQQTMIRAQTKLEFAYGLASRMAEAINDVSPATRQMLGEIWTYAEFARAAIHSAEVEAFDYGNGVWFPNGGPLAALRAALPTLVSARRRDHHAARLAQSAGRADASAARRSETPPAHRAVSARRGRRWAPRSARESSGWRGTSSAARWPAATSCTSASTWPRARETISWRMRSRQRNARDGWSMASSANIRPRRTGNRALQNGKSISPWRLSDEHRKSRRR